MKIDTYPIFVATFSEKILSPASIDLGFFKAEGPAIVVIPALFLVLLGFVFSLVWLYRDAKKREKNGFLAILFLITAWPASLLWWIWLRPPVAQSPK